MRLFHDQLEELFQQVLAMGRLAESMVQTAVQALLSGDESMAAAVYADETRVNQLQVGVDETAVKLTALQQPVAQDARFLFMASRIGGELERIADQAINICQNTHYVLEEPPRPPLKDLFVMADQALKMIRDALAAMLQRDPALANQVLENENEVDALRDRIFRILLADMQNNPKDIQRAMSMILIARNLERVGDHATNIAEEVIYWIQGRDIRHGHAVAGGGAAGISA